MTLNKSEPSLLDLLRPLSAKVVPASARRGVGGKELTDTEAIRAQRLTRRQGNTKGITKRARKG